MKNLTSLLIALTACIYCSHAQSNDSEKSNAQLLSDAMGEDRVVVSYHVEERINMKFGARVTTYEVGSLSLVNSHDLGPDNTRKITPRYGKAKVVAKSPPAPEIVPVPASIPVPVPVTEVAEVKALEKQDNLQLMPVASTKPIEITAESPVASAAIVAQAVIPMVAEVTARKEVQSVKINIVDTYERILNKGYESVDMLKKVANNRFYDGNLSVAAKWYKKLFALTTELEAEYYYRYSTSLKSINEIGKANEMMTVFEKMNHLK